MHSTLEKARYSYRAKAVDRAAGTLQDVLLSTPMPRLDNDWDGVNATLAAMQSERLWRELTDRHQLPLGYHWPIDHYIAFCAVGWGAKVCDLVCFTQGGRP
jgi:hypothetical protein